MLKNLILITIFLISFTSAQINIGGNVSSQGYINIIPPTTITSSGGTGANVSSVTSSTNCITVNPTTGDVILTFNSSCDTNSGGQISNSSLNAMYLNLSGTNANQNVNIGIYNHTANWFKGLFNWIIGANPSQRYLTFNGSTLDFSESNLNQTIDRRIVLNNTNLRNPFNQDLNTTNNVQFNNISITNITSSDWIIGKNLFLTLTGTAFFGDTSMLFDTIDVGGGLVSIPIIKFTGGAGLTVGAIADGLYIVPQLVTTSPRILLAREPTAQDVWVFENNNNTGVLQMFRQNPFAGGTMSADIQITSNMTVSGNVTVGELFKLRTRTLPTCNTATNETIARNNSGVYDCFNGVWNKL